MSNNSFFRIYYIVKAHRTSSDEKKNKIKTLHTNCLHSHEVSIRELGRILGNIVASFPADTFGPLHYRKINLSSKAVSEIHWWINSIDDSCHHINNISNPEVTIYTESYKNLTMEYLRLEVSGIRHN